MTDELGRPPDTSSAAQPIAPAPGEIAKANAPGASPPAPGTRIGLFSRTTGDPNEPALGPFVFLEVQPDGRWHVQPEHWPEGRTMTIPPETAANPRSWATAEQVEAGPGWFKGQVRVPVTGITLPGGLGLGTGGAPPAPQTPEHNEPDPRTAT